MLVGGGSVCDDLGCVITGDDHMLTSPPELADCGGLGVTFKKDTMYSKKKFQHHNNNKGFINLHFLQKLNCQKTEWDQARFSSLV